MKPTRKVKKVARPPILGSESIAYMPPSERSTTSVSERQEVTNRVGELLDGDRPATLGVVPGAIDGMNWPNDWQGGQGKGKEGKASQDTGGRSEKVSPLIKVTAKPSSPLSHKPLLSQPTPKSSVIPSQDMPVLGDPMGVGEDLGGEVVQTYQQVPFTPDFDPPLDTSLPKVSSPFITGNERIDRRTAFTQYCRLGEGRTYMDVAKMMAVPLESIKKWAKEDNWENAYRERITADIQQVAKEENIHEVLDMRREMIALLKEKLTAAKNGESVFKSPKEMLDVLRQVEELTGSSSASSVRPGQIFVIISEDEWKAREQMNEKSRKEESGST